MSIDHEPRTGSQQIPVSAAPTKHTPATAPSSALALLRIGTGFIFLWAFLDKTFGWGYATSSASAWINGGSPTKGFLGNAHVGPFADMFRSWAGQGWADWLFMIGLLAIGVALVLGIGLRIAAVAGTIILVLMWAAEWPLARSNELGAATRSTNPIVDYHLIYAAALIALAATNAGDTWGFGRQWHKITAVTNNPWLR